MRILEHDMPPPPPQRRVLERELSLIYTLRFYVSSINKWRAGSVEWERRSREKKEKKKIYSWIAQRGEKETIFLFSSLSVRGPNDQSISQQLEAISCDRGGGEA